MKIFYAWQCDSPLQTNRNAIKSALTAATAKIEQALPGTRIELDEATREMSGSQNIPDSIRRKIEEADIFVGDVTTINAPVPPGAKPTPNPNVAFEVGYAAAHLGWARIILVLNTAMGDMKDLPFDFDRQRISDYSIQPAQPNNGLKTLTLLLQDALTTIIDQNPARPAELSKLNPEQIKRKRDLDNALAAMECIHVPTIQEQIYNFPREISDRAMWFSYDFIGLVDSKSFHIYDADLDSALRGLADAWKLALAPSNFYHHPAHLDRAIFSNPMDAPLSDEQEKAWQHIEVAAKEMHNQFNKLLSIIRDRYLEIHIEETSASAIKRYFREKKEMESAVLDR
jgi:hypothetical protein